MKRTKITRHKNIANNLIIKNHQILNCDLILNKVLFGNISKKPFKTSFQFIIFILHLFAIFSVPFTKTVSSDIQLTFFVDDKNSERVDLVVNFINILRAHFSYESASPSFSLVTFWLWQKDLGKIKR